MFRPGKYVVDSADDAPPKVASIAVVLNDNDKTISNQRAEELVDTWNTEGGRVTVVRLPKSLGLPHDVVDLAQPKQRVDDVYPVLVPLVRIGT